MRIDIVADKQFFIYLYLILEVKPCDERVLFLCAAFMSLQPWFNAV